MQESMTSVGPFTPAIPQIDCESLEHPELVVRPCKGSNTRFHPIATGTSGQDSGHVAAVDAGTSFHLMASLDSQTLTNMIAALYLPDPTPDQRHRDPDIVPAFLKPLPSSQQDFLPPLFTILHSVPAFQSAIMAYQAEDYGYNQNWWKENTSRDMGLVESEINEATQRLALLHESQRLAAFLEHSHRLYGSAASLAAVLSSMSDRAPLGTDYLKALDEALAANEQDIICSRGALFRSSYTRPVPEEDAYAILLHSPDSDAVPQENLYDALDECLYSNELLFAQTAPVIAVRLGKRASIAVPYDLLLDRYHVAKEEKIKYLIQQRSEKRQEYQALEAQKQKIQTFAKPQGGNSGDAGKLMDTALELLTKRASYMTQAGSMWEDDKNAMHPALQTIIENVEKRKTGEPV